MRPHFSEDFMPGNTLAAAATAALLAAFAPRMSAAAQNAPTVNPTPPGTRSSNTFFVSWHDPKENAFQVGIPKGWQASGGTFRAAPLDVRMQVRAQSPDGRITLYLGDAEIAPRQVPDAMMAQVGFREGQTIPGAAGGQILLARFQTGSQFGQQYVRSKLCSDARITSASDLAKASEDMNRRIAPMAAQWRASARASAGEVYYECRGGAGYVFVDTLLIGPRSGPGAYLWVVYQLAAVFTSDPAQAPYGAYVLHTALETLAMNPRWEEANQRQTDRVTQSVTAMQRAMAQSIAERGARQAASASAGGFNHPNDGRLPVDLRKKWAGEDVINQKRSDATLGQRWMHAPDGTNVRVDNSYSNYWRDNSGRVVPGPESGGPPPGSQGQYQQLSPGWR
jgi:hypothetical protein